MSLESEMKKFNGNLERLSVAIESLVTGERLGQQVVTSFEPVTETKIVEVEVKKVSKEPVKKENRVVPEDLKEEPVVQVGAQGDVDEGFDTDFDVTERPSLTAKQVQIFAREKMNEFAEKDPKLQIKIKKKITDLGASKITELDQDGLDGLEKFLREL